MFLLFKIFSGNVVIIVLFSFKRDGYAMKNGLDNLQNVLYTIDSMCYILFKYPIVEGNGRTIPFRGFSRQSSP